MKFRKMKLLVKALRSGEFKQGEHSLARKRSSKRSDWQFCCLGVACEVARANGCKVKRVTKDDRRYYDKEDGVMPISVKHWFGFQSQDGTLVEVGGDRTRYGNSLIMMNDTMRADFNRIADHIEQNYKNL